MQGSLVIPACGQGAEENVKEKDIIYSRGFFAFLCGTQLLGVLLGTLSYCLTGEDFTKSLGLLGSSFISTRFSEDHAALLIKSMAGTSLSLIIVMLLGFCALGQPFQIAMLVFRGMGVGLTLSQLYLSFGRGHLLYSVGLMLPGAAISSAALCFAVREALALSNIYLRLTLSDRQVCGLLDTAKLYAAKFFLLEAVLAFAAGIDVLCNYLFIGYFA